MRGHDLLNALSGQLDWDRQLDGQSLLLGDGDRLRRGCQ